MTNAWWIIWLLPVPVQQDTLACPAGFLDKPIASVISTVPEFRNRKAAEKIVLKEYQDLPTDSTAKSPSVWIATDRAGRIARVILARASVHEQWDSAALRAARQFEFVPATYNGNPVCSWVQMPVSRSRQ